MRFGIDRLIDEAFAPLQAQRVGLFSHLAAVNRDLLPTVELFRQAEAVDLRALFGPEHGFSGARADGVHVADAHDPRTGVPVYSLYGESVRPTASMLADLDLVVCDVQDIGVRYYTYLWTLTHILEACGEFGVPLLLLDRPNPLGALLDGGPLDPALASLVGRYPIPIQHGLTLGELLPLINEAWNPHPAEVRVIPVEGLREHFTWADAGRPFVPTSPNMPHLSAAKHYPGACLIEGTNLSEGRGTSLPFEIVGAPFVDAWTLAEALNALNLDGVRFRPHVFQPSASKHAGEVCQGVQVHLMQEAAYRPLRVWLNVIATFQRLYPDDFAFLPPNPATNIRHFDRLIGDTRTREALQAGQDLIDIIAAWEPFQLEFVERLHRFQADAASPHPLAPSPERYAGRGGNLSPHPPGPPLPKERGEVKSPFPSETRLSGEGVRLRAFQKRLDALLQPALERVAPAVTLAVAHRGERVFSGAWGHIDPDARQHPVTLTTLFDLASLTKLATTTALLTLLHREGLALTTPLADILPAFAAVTPRPIDGGQDPHTKTTLAVDERFREQTVNPAAVTLWHLLTHTSGLPPWRDVYTVAPPPMRPHVPDSVPRERPWRAALERLCTYAFVAPIGEGVRYSDVGLMLAGEAVARLYGAPLDVAISELVLRPLDMAQTCFNPVREHGHAYEKIAPTENDPTWRQRRVWGEVHDENACGVGGVAGHAGLFAPVDDVLKLGLAWLTPDALNIPETLRQQAITQQAVTAGERRGLGWMLPSPENSSAGAHMSRDAYGHTGFTGTSLWVDPERELVIALLTNRVYWGREVPGIHALRRAVHDAIVEELAP